MIGKPHWFKRRKYTGWGFTPATWEGWLYIIVAILPFVLLMGVSPINQTRMILIIIWALIVCVDFVDIVIHLPKDERDRIHEAIAERNALWIIVAVLGIGIAFQAASGAVSHALIPQVDPFLLVALFAGLLAKIISNIYLDKKD
ncbi:MAG: hypothetical protein NTZ87_01155 [Candidatus Nomurabacteria bacterium]|nr:hypothetical protein [Candidatus Nomurabacteria bacterium]